MHARGSACTVLVLSGWLVACGTGAPQSRMDAYVGTSSDVQRTGNHALSPGTPVAVVVLFETVPKDAAPALSASSREFLIKRTRNLLEETLPLQVTTVVPDTQPAPGGQARLPFQALGQRHGVDWLAVAIYSAVEMEAPQPLPLDGTRGGGGAMGRLPGNVTSVFALAELALVEAASGWSTLRSQGRTVVTLEQLANGLRSNAFPSIYRGGGQQRIAAPRDDAEAHDALRTLAYEEALRYALHDLHAAWSTGVTIPVLNPPAAPRSP